MELYLNHYYLAVIRSIDRIYKLYIRGMITACEAKDSTKEVANEMDNDLNLSWAKLESLLNENIRESNREKDVMIKDIIIQIYLNGAFAGTYVAEVNALITYAMYLATGKFYLKVDDLY